MTLSDSDVNFYIQCTKKAKQNLAVFEEVVSLILW